MCCQVQEGRAASWGVQIADNPTCQPLWGLSQLQREPRLRTGASWVY